MLLSVISSDTTRAITPTAVSLPVLARKPSSFTFRLAAAPGRKLAKM